MRRLLPLRKVVHGPDVVRVPFSPGGPVFELAAVVPRVHVFPFGARRVLCAGRRFLVKVGQEYQLVFPVKLERELEGRVRGVGGRLEHKAGQKLPRVSRLDRPPHDSSVAHHRGDGDQHDCHGPQGATVPGRAVSGNQGLHS